MSGKRENASDQLRRILAVIPWIAERPGVELSEAASHFGVSVSQLTKELGVVFMVGVPPYSPDALVDVVIDEGRVWISYADYFRRPLRLTAGQGLGLLAASQALLATPGNEHGEALERALAKLANSLGLSPRSEVEVEIGQAGQQYVEELSQAVANDRAVLIDYYSYGRDELTRRTIEPSRVFSSNGAWYSEAYCQLAEDRRLFRLDRITSLRDQGPATGPQSLDHEPRESGVECTIRLAPRDAWVADTYECQITESHPDGFQTVVLKVNAIPWLERLALRLSVDSELVEASGPEDASSLCSLAARRILARYSG